MKKPGLILIAVTVAFFCLLGGIFVGRNFMGAYIPAKDAIAAHTQPTENGTVPMDGRIDLNTATLQQLQLLPGIGETMAQRILDHREEIGSFTDIRELMDISGIGEKKFEQIAPYVKVG